jgi:peptidyl-prolyl cis-trans isomerase D
MAPEYRAVSLIHLRPADLAEEIAVTEEELRTAFENRRNEFATPERREIEQVVFSSQADAQAMHERLTAGEDFAAVAEEVLGQAPVSLGTTDGSGLVPALREAAFAVEAAAVSAPVQSPLGWHILRIVAVEPAEEPSFEALRERLRAEMAEREAVDALIGTANALDDELGGGASLDDAAAVLGLSVTRIDAIDRQGLGRDGEAIADLPDPRIFLPEAFEAPTGETGLLRETEEGGFFVLRVDSIDAAQQRPLAEVREKVVTLWRQGEVARLTREKGDALVAELETGKSLDDLAAENDLSIAESQPMTRDETDPARTPAPRFAAAIFELDDGAVTGLPVSDGYLITRLDHVVPADASDDSATFEATEQALSQSLKADFFDLFMAALELEHRVEINQATVDEVLNSF